jgi:hypothetical protein
MSNKSLQNVTKFEFLGTQIINQNCIYENVKTSVNSEILYTAQFRIFFMSGAMFEIMKFKYTNNLVCCFIWVYHHKNKVQIQGVWEQVSEVTLWS